MQAMIQRRRLFLAAASLASTAWPTLAAPTLPRPGGLIAIGGSEDRSPDGPILQRFIALSGGTRARIAVLTAASGDPQASGHGYRRAFAALGVADVALVDARDAAQADDPAAAAALRAADGIFIAGGDQRRLMASIDGSALADALRRAHHERGACIAGTSAGAAALSGRMLADGDTPRLPEKDAARLDRGLGLVPGAIIDQHFSERRRLGRLLSVVAAQPDLLGLGIDEDTALVIEQGRAVEVIGRGTVTLLDGRRMRSNIDEAEPRERLELLGVQLHLLPAGNRYALGDGMPPSLAQALSALMRQA